MKESARIPSIGTASPDQRDVGRPSTVKLSRRELRPDGHELPRPRVAALDANVWGSRRMLGVFKNDPRGHSGFLQALTLHRQHPRRRNVQRVPHSTPKTLARDTTPVRAGWLGSMDRPDPTWGLGDRTSGPCFPRGHPQEPEPLGMWSSRRTSRGRNSRRRESGRAQCRSCKA